MKSKNISPSLTQHNLRQRMWAALGHNYHELGGALSTLNKWSLSSRIRVAVIPKTRSDVGIATPEMAELAFSLPSIELDGLEDI